MGFPGSTWEWDVAAVIYYNGIHEEKVKAKMLEKAGAGSQENNKKGLT